MQGLQPYEVKYVKIKEAFKRVRGTPITAAQMKDINNSDGDVVIYAGGKTVVKAYAKDIPKANITKVPSVLVQSRGIIDAIYCDIPFTFKNEMWAYTADEATTVKYLYYLLKNGIESFRYKASSMGSFPQISLGDTEDYEIPLPPLHIQEEIVSILDRFDTLVNDISKGLPAEIEARQKQYEFYREKLLTFEEV